MTKEKPRSSRASVRPSSGGGSDGPSVSPQGSSPRPRSPSFAEGEHGALRRLTLGIPVATLGAAVIAGVWLDLGTAILVLAFGVLVGAITLFWASLRTLSGDVPPSLEEALALGRPSAAEEQKRAVLQALRDLEYERSVGKISEVDYTALRERYRAEAKRLLRAVDEDMEPLRKQAEAYLEQQVETGKAAPVSRNSRSGDDGKAHCRKCGAVRDSDAVFCKKCGARLSDSVDKAEDATA